MDCDVTRRRRHRCLWNWVGECVFTSTCWLLMLHTSYSNMTIVPLVRPSFNRSSAVSKLPVKTAPYIEPIASLISLAHIPVKRIHHQHYALCLVGADLWPRLMCGSLFCARFWVAGKGVGLYASTESWFLSCCCFMLAYLCSSFVD